MNNDQPREIPEFAAFQRYVIDCPHVNDALAEPCTPRPCATCPFRRTRRPWSNAWRWLVNVFRLRLRRVQDCHNAPGVKCNGAVVAIAGGSADVYSPEEFERLVPAPSIASAKLRYDAAKAEAKGATT